MGRVVHGSNGENVWVFKTNANLSEAFKFGPKNDIEKPPSIFFIRKYSRKRFPGLLQEN